MKTLDVAIWTVLTVGGLNWGFVGIFNINLIAAMLGDMTFMTRIIYALIGFAAVYDIVATKAIWQRWGMHYTAPSH